MHIVRSYRARLAFTVALAFGAHPAVAKSLSVIHGFDANAELGGGIIADQKGTLYGVLTGGKDCGRAGCVYALVPAAQQGGKWTYSILYQFTHKGDGYGPAGQLTLGPSGELYGFTGYGSGIVYRLTPPQGGSGAWAFTKLGALGDGFAPNPGAALVFSNGALFGLSTGGSQTCPYVGCGGVFKVAPDLNGKWGVTTIVAFDGESLGGSPTSLAGPDSNGGFYVANQYQGKVVYLVPSDDMWQATLAASFSHATGLGCLVKGANGNIYGVADHFSRGKLFQLQPDGGGADRAKTIIAEISDHQNAPCPEILGPGGSLIGTVFGDQDAYYGDIFQLSPPAAGSSDWTYKILAKVAKSGRYGPDNVVFGLGGDLYTPVNSAYGPPAAILKYVYRDDAIR